MQSSLDPITVIATAGIMARAIYTDLRSRTIPNRLTYPFMLFMLAYSGMAYGLEGLLFSIKGLLLGTALLMPLYFMGGLGAGDAKLLGAAGAALGAQGVFNVFLFTALAGGLYASGIFLFHFGKTRGVIDRASLMLRGFIYSRRFTYIPEAKHEQAPRLCYAVPIAVGTAGALAWRAVFCTYFI